MQILLVIRWIQEILLFFPLKFDFAFVMDRWSQRFVCRFNFNAWLLEFRSRLPQSKWIETEKQKRKKIGTQFLFIFIKTDKIIGEERKAHEGFWFAYFMWHRKSPNMDLKSFFDPFLGERFTNLHHRRIIKTNQMIPCKLHPASFADLSDFLFSQINFCSAKIDLKTGNDVWVWRALEHIFHIYWRQ